MNSVAFLPVVVAAVSSGQVTANGDLASLPLRDRCVVAAKVAQEVVKMMDFVTGMHAARFATDAEKWPDTRINIFVSKFAAADREREESIFRKGEDCGEIVAHHLFVLDRPLKVNVGAGQKEDLPEDQTYELVRSRTIGVRRWEFSWRYGSEIWSCPKKKSPVPEVCLQPTVPSVPLPTLKVVIERRQRHGDFDIIWSALEFIHVTRRWK